MGEIRQTIASIALKCDIVTSRFTSSVRNTPRTVDSWFEARLNG